MSALPRETYATHFAAQRVAENYRYRPPYSPEVSDTFVSLLVEPYAVLDVGCGPGKLTFALVDRARRVDAIDPSEEMLRLARAAPDGANPRIRFMHSRTEDAKLDPPYGLVVAGASIHWMKLDIVLPRLAQVLAPSGVLAMVDGDAPIGAPWEAEENALFAGFIERLQGAPPKFPTTRLQGLKRPILEHALFQRMGGKVTAPWPVTQSIDDYLRCQHSRATWSEDFMGEAMTEEFDTKMRALLAPHAVSGMLRYEVRSRLEWGKPLKVPINPVP
jgi:SAM-dependent methyltransferase